MFGNRLLLIEFEVDGKGYPKGLVSGNLLCWYGNFEWIAKHVQDPKAKLLKKWNYRRKSFGDVNRGRDIAVKTLYTADSRTGKGSLDKVR